MKIKKRRKSSRMHGRKMGSHGYGARVKKKGKGSRGGMGMSGSGKRADQKKTWIIKKFGNAYFGKQGETSRGTARDKTDRINLRDIQEKYLQGEVDLRNHKILGDGEVKGKFVIRAKSASVSAIEKVKKSGGKIILEKKSKGKKAEKISEKSGNKMSAETF